MAVVSRPPAGQSGQRRARGEGDGGLHHKEWNARAQAGSGRSSSGGVTSSRSRGVVYRGDEVAGGLGGWCGGCMTRSGAVSPPPRGGERGRKGDAKPGSGDVKSFSLERSGSTPGSSPAFRPRLSPGKVSPLVEVREQQAAPVAATPPAVFSMANYVSMAGKMHPSSPPVEKIKASPTLFEMMTHEQELQGVKAVHTLSLSQQLTFQEKMKSILAGKRTNAHSHGTRLSLLLWRSFRT
jgi:hypothetical protein